MSGTPIDVAWPDGEVPVRASPPCGWCARPRPRTATTWRTRGFFATDDETVVGVSGAGDTGGYGGLGSLRGTVFSWDAWTDSIQKLALEDGGSSTVVHDAPNGWYNRPNFGMVQRAQGTWGAHGTYLP